MFHILFGRGTRMIHNVQRSTLSHAHTLTHIHMRTTDRLCSLQSTSVPSDHLFIFHYWLWCSTGLPAVFSPVLWPKTGVHSLMVSTLLSSSLPLSLSLPPSLSLPLSISPSLSVSVSEQYKVPSLKKKQVLVLFSLKLLCSALPASPQFYQTLTPLHSDLPTPPPLWCCLLPLLHTFCMPHGKWSFWTSVGKEEVKTRLIQCQSPLIVIVHSSEYRLSLFNVIQLNTVTTQTLLTCTIISKVYWSVFLCEKSA